MMISKLLKHPLLKSSLIYTLCDAVNKAVPFLILPLLSYYLTPGDYGIVANFGVLLAVVTILIGLSVEGVIGVNYYRITKEELGKYIFNSLSLITISTGIVLIISYFFQNLIFESFKIPFSYVLLLILMAMSTILTSINLTLWRLEEKPLSFGFYQISQMFLNVCVSLFLVINLQLGWVGRVQGMVIAAIIFGCFSLLLLIKRGYLNAKFDKTIRLAILAFGLPLIPHSLSMWIRSGIDRIYITNMFEESQVGLYATGFQFGTFISFLILAFNNAFVPYLYKILATNDNKEVKNTKKKLRKITFIAFVILFCFCFIFYIISILILNDFFSQAYQESQMFIFWALLSQFFQSGYLLFVNYIFYFKKTKQLAFVTFSCALLQILLSFFLLKIFGPIGAAYSTVIVSFLNFILIFILSNRIYPLGWFSPNT